MPRVTISATQSDKSWRTSSPRTVGVERTATWKPRSPGFERRRTRPPPIAGGGHRGGSFGVQHSSNMPFADGGQGPQATVIIQVKERLVRAVNHPTGWLRVGPRRLQSRILPTRQGSRGPSASRAAREAQMAPDLCTTYSHPPQMDLMLFFPICTYVTLRPVGTAPREGWTS